MHEQAGVELRVVTAVVVGAAVEGVVVTAAKGRQAMELLSEGTARV